VNDQKAPDEVPVPALDDLEENPDNFAGELVTPEHTLDVGAFVEEPEQPQPTTEVSDE
jgi:hypothetical protein